MLQCDSKLYVQVLLSSLRYNSWNVAMRISTISVCSGPLKFFTLQAPEDVEYVSQHVQVPLSSLRQPPEMLQYVSQLYVQVPLSSLRNKLLKS